MAEETKKPTPPYVSYVTFRDTIRRLAHGGHFPAQIDKSILSSMAGSTQNQFLIALRYFGLISGEANTSSDKLKELATSDDATWKAGLKQMLETQYAKQLPLLQNGTPNLLRDSFGEMSIATPAARFLVAAAKDAGFLVSPHLNKISNPARKKRPKNGNGTTNGSGGGEADVEDQDDGDEGEDEQPPLKPKGAAGSGAPAGGGGAPPVDSVAQMLLAKFPNFDPSWSPEQQANWFAAYQKLIEMNDKK